MKTVVVFISLLLLAGITLAQDDGTCMDKSDPFPWESEDKMDHCCWYYEKSCCDPAMLGTMDPIADKVTGHVYNLLTDDGKNTNSTFEKCFTYLENFFCFPCSPNSGSFAVLTDDTLTVTVCEDFCDEFYDACTVDDLPGAQAYFNRTGITSGAGLCVSLPAILSPLLEVPNPSPSASASPSASPAPEPSPSPTSTDTTSGGETETETDTPTDTITDTTTETITDTTNGTTTTGPDSKVFSFPKVIVVVSDGDSECFEGVSSSTIGKSSCTYWDPKDYDDSSDDFWWYWVFFVLAAIIIIVIIIVVVIVAGVIIYKKRFATQVVTSNTGDYPNLDELEE